MDLSHLSVLVTGGGGIGVGSGVCKALDQFGATLIINELDIGKAEEACHQYRHAFPVQADIGDESQVKNMFTRVDERFGPINGLVNNAGVGLVKEVHEITEEEFDRVFNVNMKGMWLVTKYFVRQVLNAPESFKKELAAIVNISSIHAYASQPKYSTYASTKAGAEGFTRSIAYELGQYGIRCNSIGPGMVHSEQNYDIIKNWAADPVQWESDFIQNQQVLPNRIHPVDVGQVVAFLLSPLSKAVTGQSIYVDAGTTSMAFNRDFIEPDKS